MILPLLACLTLVGASSAPLAVSSLPYGNEPFPQCAVYDDENFSITLTAEELNNYTFTNLGNSFLELPAQYDLSSSTITYNDVVYTYDELTSYPNDSYISYVNSTVKIGFYGLGYDEYNGKFYYPDMTVGGFTSSIVWDIDGLYSIFKPAIQADIEANSSGMSGVEVVNEIVDILAGGLTSLGSALGGAIATFAQSLAFQDGELSVYFVLIVVFAGVSLAIGLTTLLFNWLTNLGK